MVNSIKLSNATLSQLPDEIKRPRYDRSAIKPGVVHIGVGNFHRAHQAWYLQQLFNDQRGFDWGIVGAGVRQSDATQREKLTAQDYLTTLIELDPAGVSAEVVGSIIDFIPVEEDNGALIRQLAHPNIRVVTLTVTEGGYYQLPASGEFDASHPDVRHDAENLTRPHTAFGAIIQALRLRRDSKAGPFTIQSCDNLRGNGDVAKQTVLSLARLADPELAHWIDQHCSFPNSMVDCIVPATGPKEIALAQQLGIEDNAPVTHENFRQWVIEDNFCAGRPAWHLVGVTFTDNVSDYEAMKIRILNAGHQLVANVGELLSIETISDALACKPIRDFFRKVETTEIAPHVCAVPGMTAEQYIDLITERFANPSIVDTTRRVAFDGSSRHPGFVLPIVRAALTAGTPVVGLALGEALWARMCEGTREDGSIIEPNDPHWEDRQVVANAARKRPLAWLEQQEIYGDLIENRRFANAFSEHLEILWQQGCFKVLEDYVSANSGDSILNAHSN